MFWIFRNRFVTHIYVYIYLVWLSYSGVGGGSRIFILCSVKNRIYDLHKADQSNFHEAVLAAFPQVQGNNCQALGASNGANWPSGVKREFLKEYEVCRLEGGCSGKCVRPKGILGVRQHGLSGQDTNTGYNNQTCIASTHHTFMQSPRMLGSVCPGVGRERIFPFSFHDRSGALDPTNTMPKAVFLKRKAGIR